MGPFDDFGHSDPEWQAQANFNKSKLVKYYKSNGVDLSCEEICLKLSEQQFTLLQQVAPQFFALKNKINHVVLARNSEIKFSHPVGDYGIYLPWNGTPDILDGVFLVFDKLLKLESAIGKKVFVSRTLPIFAEALDVLLKNSFQLKELDIPEFYLTNESTKYSAVRKMAQINVDTVRGDFDSTMDRLRLFIRAYSKLPYLDISVSSDDEKNYLFVQKMIDNASKINRAVGSHYISLTIDVSDEDSYISGRNLLDSAIIIVSSTISPDQLIEILDYEVYLLDLIKLLRIRVDHEEYRVPYGQYQECKSKLVLLQDAILRKVKSIRKIRIDYIYDGNSLYGEDGTLVLKCGRDSVEQMLNVISQIPANQ